MSESPSTQSKAKTSLSVMEHRQTKDYFDSNNEIRHSLRFGTKLLEDETNIPENEKIRLSEMRKKSSSADLDPKGVSGFTGDSTIERNSSRFIGDLTKPPEVHFVTGSSYEGTWDALGMSGVGRYTMPHGTIYDGEIRDGLFHGQGSLYWSKNQRLDVVHLRGELKEHRYTCHGGFILDDKDWSYCKFPDRRFYESLKKGLRPGGRTLKTARQPTTILPAGTYDTGDGIFDSKTQRITSLDDSNKVLRVPSQDEYKWIIEKCRRHWTEPTGYRPDLNENWSENSPELPYNLPMSQDSPDHWWKRLTTFAKDHVFMGGRNLEDSNYHANETFSSPVMCMCGKLVMDGEPCHCIPVSTRFTAEESEQFENIFSEGTLEGTDENHVKQEYSESSKDSSIDGTLKNTKSFILGRLEKKSVINEANTVESVTNKMNVHKNLSSNLSRKEFLENSLGNVSLGESFDKDKQYKSFSQSSGRTQRKKQSIHGSTENLKEESVSHDEDFREKIILRSDTEEERKHSGEFQINMSEEKFDEKLAERKVLDAANVNDAVETFDGNETEKNIGLPRYETDERTLKKNGEKNYTGQNYPVKKTEEDKLLQKYVDGSQDVELMNETIEQIPNKSSITEGEFDYVSEPIPREKVMSVIKAETKDGRRLETKRLSEEVTKKYHEQTPTETGQIEKQSDSNPAPDRSNVNTKKQQDYFRNEYRADESLEHESSGNLTNETLSNEVVKERSKNDDEPTTKMSGSNMVDEVKSSIESQLHYRRESKSFIDAQRKFDTNVQSKSIITSKEDVFSLGDEDKISPKVSTENNTETVKFTASEKSKNSFGEIFLADDIIMAESMNSVKSSLKSKIDDKDNVEIQESETESGLKFVNDNTTLESEKKPKPKKFNEITEENVIRNTLDTDKLSQMSETMTAENTPLTSKSIDEKSSSARDVTSLEKSESSNSSKHEVADLDNVHPSLVTLVSTKRKFPREKDKTKICEKVWSKGKPEIEPMSANVWRLSGVNQDYGPKTKIEDLLFHPALTAPTSENIEYVRKPCNYRVCKTTVTAAATSASSTRKQKPCKVPTNSRVSSVHKNLNDKK